MYSMPADMSIEFIEYLGVTKDDPVTEKILLPAI